LNVVRSVDPPENFDSFGDAVSSDDDSDDGVNPKGRHASGSSEPPPVDQEAKPAETLVSGIDPGLLQRINEMRTKATAPQRSVRSDSDLQSDDSAAHVQSQRGTTVQSQRGTTDNTYDLHTGFLAFAPDPARFAAQLRPGGLVGSFPETVPLSSSDVSEPQSSNEAAPRVLGSSFTLLDNNEQQLRRSVDSDKQVPKGSKISAKPKKERKPKDSEDDRTAAAAEETNAGIAGAKKKHVPAKKMPDPALKPAPAPTESHHRRSVSPAPGLLARTGAVSTPQTSKALQRVAANVHASPSSRTATKVTPSRAVIGQTVSRSDAISRAKTTLSTAGIAATNLIAGKEIHHGTVDVGAKGKHGGSKVIKIPVRIVAGIFLLPCISIT
jgi:hypothetical protein